jgi:hypothetical protein
MNSTRDNSIVEKSLLHDRIIGRWDIPQQTPRIAVLYNSGILSIGFLLYNNDTMMPCSLSFFHRMSGASVVPVRLRHRICVRGLRVLSRTPAHDRLVVEG